MSLVTTIVMSLVTTIVMSLVTALLVKVAAELGRDIVGCAAIGNRGLGQGLRVFLSLSKRRS
ncbi:MAG: hypothetical protein LBJ41_06380 [Treponema sp.]|nr:hypothetical protein [Treponema sp.]